MHEIYLTISFSSDNEHSNRAGKKKKRTKEKELRNI